MLDKGYFNELPGCLIMPLPEIANDKNKPEFLSEKVCHVETAAKRK